MVPPETDPCWARFVSRSEPYALSSLAARIMYGQVRLLAKRDVAQAVSVARAFFARNEALARDDLRMIVEGKG